MKKIILSGLVASLALLLLGELGLYLNVWFFPTLAGEYFDPIFASQSNKIMIYYIHPFIIGMALSWFWQRFKGVLRGSFLTRGIEFGFIYAVVAIVPMMWMIYATMNVSLEMVFSWLILGVMRGIIAGLIFEKMNP